MTVLALKLSRVVNGVSELHGCVSRHMWQCLFPGKKVEEVPIGHITNGIHLLGWMKGTVRRFWRTKPGRADMEAGSFTPGFPGEIGGPNFISGGKIFGIRYPQCPVLIRVGAGL